MVNFFPAVCEAVHTSLPMPMICRARDGAVPPDWELAMAARKPTPLRWSEEAEASQVFEWATLEHGSPNPAAPIYICPAKPARRFTLPTCFAGSGAFCVERTYK